MKIRDDLGYNPVPQIGMGLQDFEDIVHNTILYIKKKYPNNHNSNDRWLALIGEEFGELCQAINDGEINNVVEEGTQTIAAIYLMLIDFIKRVNVKDNRVINNYVSTNKEFKQAKIIETPKGYTVVATEPKLDRDFQTKEQCEKYLIGKGFKIADKLFKVKYKDSHYIVLADTHKEAAIKVVNRYKDAKEVKSGAMNKLEKAVPGIRNELKNAKEEKRKATALEVLSQIQGYVNEAYANEKKEIKEKANKILSDLKSQFNLDDVNLKLDD